MLSCFHKAQKSWSSLRYWSHRVHHNNRPLLQLTSITKKYAKEIVRQSKAHTSPSQDTSPSAGSIHLFQGVRVINVDPPWSRSQCFGERANRLCHPTKEARLPCALRSLNHPLLEQGGRLAWKCASWYSREMPTRARACRVCA